ncbi:LLM class flavin-dependent oxidoreductase [Halovenus marina]|uniref:LLM class flavin-dependent oxidoreductase n=1 Tax=Halovenus marina TaxID=3396621 RepID=UPI003F554224
MTTAPSFGIMLPHFGPDCDREFIVETATLAEELGFDSVWVRDHLYVPPEHQEHGGIVEKRLVEAIQTLTYIAAVTDDLTLATGSLNPHRHPLKLSQCLGTLDYLSTGDVIAAIGAGTFKGEFDAVDIPFDDRGDLVEEQLEILERTLNGTDVDYEGEHYAFENVTLDPRPEGDLPLWYGGLSPFAVRRAVEYADGWFPGRMTYEKLDQRLAQLSDLEAEHDRSLDLGYLTIYSVAEDTETALSHLNADELVDDVNNILRTDHETLEDIRGSYVAGDPERCIEDIQALVDRGFEHVVLDMRNSFDHLHSMMELTADEVLPAFQ